MTAPRIIGFDARVPEAEALKDWSEDRRSVFLLRVDTSPLSADTSVWDSVFAGSQHGMEPAPGALPRPEWIGPCSPFWESFDAMNAALTGSSSPVIRVAATRHGSNPLRDSFKSAIDRAPPSSWTFLGFDVAGESFYSGLSNCGYDEAEKPALTARFASKLNAHHLFDREEDADAFRVLTDVRIKEHAPFRVVGLWRLP